MRTPFDEAVRDHAAVVLRVCRGLLGGHADAEDAWSETFLSALRAWPGLPDDADVRAWLVTIAHRKALDSLRRRARHAIPVAEIRDRPILNPTRDDDLWDAVANLPAKQRACVVHHHVAGLPYAEVAALVGGTPEAARRAAADGIRTLRTTLEGTR